MPNIAPRLACGGIVFAVPLAMPPGLKLRLGEIYPGDMAGGIAYGAVNDPKAAEKKFAGLLRK